VKEKIPPLRFPPTLFPLLLCPLPLFPLPSIPFPSLSLFARYFFRRFLPFPFLPFRSFFSFLFLPSCLSISFFSACIFLLPSACLRWVRTSNPSQNNYLPPAFSSFPIILSASFDRFCWFWAANNSSLRPHFFQNRGRSFHCVFIFFFNCWGRGVFNCLQVALGIPP